MNLVRKEKPIPASAQNDLKRLGINKLPRGWCLSRVCDVIGIKNELRCPISVEQRSFVQGIYPYYGPTGVLDHIDHYRAEGEFTLIGEDGDHFLEFTKKPQTLRVSGRINVNNHAHIVQGSDACTTDWFHFFFQHRDISHSITRQGAGRYKLTKAALERLPIVVPPVSEQRKIAEILRTWDEAIEKLEALRTVKERRLQSLREKLTYVDAQGEPTRLGEVTEEVTTRNGDGRLGREMVMGVTNSRGIVPMREQTIAEDIGRYKVVPHKAFAYNPMRINVGSIAMNEAENAILVSPDYVAFSCVRDKLLPDFLDHLKNTNWWAHYINSGGSGTVRQRTYYADLAAMKVPLPNFDQQRRIADILNTAWRDVTVTTRKITALSRQKRGLMQKLLAGEWRVTPEGARV